MTAGTEIITILCGIGGILWVGLVTFIVFNNKVYNAVKRWVFILGVISAVTACVSIFGAGFYQNNDQVQSVFSWLFCPSSILTFTIVMIIIGKKWSDARTEYLQNLYNKSVQKDLDQQKME